tara:strand:+ start:55697 stop:55840 length:144 start_codon:yes stop_codon:yes gene_type:complete
MLIRNVMNILKRWVVMIARVKTVQSGGSAGVIKENQYKTTHMGNFTG